MDMGIFIGLRVSGVSIFGGSSIPSGDALTMENADPLTTEAGDPLTTET
jgi:hypothetical protein